MMVEAEALVCLEVGEQVGIQVHVDLVDQAMVEVEAEVRAEVVLDGGVKMTKEEWSKIRHFNMKENWGDPYKMSFDLLKRLDALREFIGFPIYVLCGYETSGHTEHSLHYVGKAADVYCRDISLLDFYLAAERFGFGGIGTYTFGTPSGFLHLDVRETDLEQKIPSRWASYRRGEYVALDECFVRSFLLP